jgi:hypothetical protein
VQRVAVVGCGDVSIVHCEAIDAIAYAELVAVCDSDPATLEATAARYRCRASPTIASSWTPSVSLAGWPNRQLAATRAPGQCLNEDPDTDRQRMMSI